MPPPSCLRARQVRLPAAHASPPPPARPQRPAQRRHGAAAAPAEHRPVAAHHWRRRHRRARRLWCAAALVVGLLWAGRGGAGRGWRAVWSAAQRRAQRRAPGWTQRQQPLRPRACPPARPRQASTSGRCWARWAAWGWCWGWPPKTCAPTWRRRCPWWGGGCRAGGGHRCLTAWQLAQKRHPSHAKRCQAGLASRSSGLPDRPAAPPPRPCRST